VVAERVVEILEVNRAYHQQVERAAGLARLDIACFRRRSTTAGSQAGSSSVLGLPARLGAP
jgi:hypothetical protein